MNWVNALGIGLGLLSVAASSLFLRFGHKALARGLCDIGMIVGGIFG